MSIFSGLFRRRGSGGGELADSAPEALDDSAAPVRRASVAAPAAPQGRPTVDAAAWEALQKRRAELTAPGGFFGREPDTERLDRFLTEHDRGVILISGPGGVGKSALLANWAQAREAAGARSAAHFFTLGLPRTRTVVGAYRSLLAQLNAALGLDLEIGEELRPLEDALIEALKTDVSAERPLILLLDALDEADQRLSPFLPQELGAHVYLIVSERVDEGAGPDRLRPWLREKARASYAIEAMTLGPLSSAGVLDWLRAKLPASADLDATAVAARLEAVTEGTPLFLQYVIDDLVEALKTGKLAPDAVLTRIETMPAPFADYARERLEELREIGEERGAEASWARDVRRLFALLVASGGPEGAPIGQSEIEAVLERMGVAAGGLDVMALDPRVLRWFSRRAPEGDGETEFAFLHPRLAEVFEIALEGAADNRGEYLAAKTALLAHCRDWAAHGGAYAVAQLPRLLAKTGENEELRGLFLTPAWMAARLGGHGPEPLLTDYRAFSEELGEAVRLVREALDLSAGPLARDERQLIPQLVGRLTSEAARDHGEAARMSRFLTALRSEVAPPALLPPERALQQAGGAEKLRLEVHGGWVEALCPLPDGRLASGSSDGTIRLWDPASGAETARLEGHDRIVKALCPLPDGRLASASFDKTIRLWDSVSGAETARLEGHGGPVKALCLLADGRLASASTDATIRLWDPVSGAENARLKMPVDYREEITALCPLPDGRLASGYDGTIRLWDPVSGVETAMLEGHGDGSLDLYSDTVKALCTLPDGRLASGSSDKTIRLWDPASGAETARLEGHGGRVSALCPLPDGRLASGYEDKTIRLWDPVSGAETARLEGHGGWVTALCPLPDGRLASASSDKTIRLWDPASRAETARLKAPVDYREKVTALCPLPDGRLASGSDAGTIRLWDPTSGAGTARLEGHDGSVRALCPLPDGRLASGSSDKTIRLWDPVSGAETARLEGHGGGVTALCQLADGRLASASDGPFQVGTIRLWDPASGAETARLRVPLSYRDEVTALCPLPDGRLACATSLGTIRLWDPATGVETARLEGLGTELVLCQLADGQLASVSADNTIRLWDPAFGAETARLEGHGDWVRALCPLADGRLASASWDKTIRLWDSATGAETARLELDSRCTSLCQMSETSTLVVGCADGRLIWTQLVDEPLDARGAPPEVFISYARADAALCSALAQRLEARGISVWYDREIEGGAYYRKRIRQAIDEAKAVVVIFSAASCESDWVTAEASRAHKQDKLIPLRTAGLPTSEIPDPYGAVLNVLGYGDEPALLQALGAKGVQPE